MLVLRSSLVFVTLLLIVQSTSEAKVEAIIGSINLDQNANLPAKIPETEEPEIILSREQFVISYNKYRRAPNWSAWKLEASHLGSVTRTNNFHQDAELEKLLSKYSDLKAVNQDEYKGSCFDRGHQTPSADRTDNKENNSATFVMSNMTPQTPFLNRVIWAHLEEYTRELVIKQGKTAYIIAGPIYDQDFGYIGPKKDIKVPSKHFKIVLFIDAQSDRPATIISVVMPNTLENGKNPALHYSELCKPLTADKNDKLDWMKYQATIEEIEKLSGLHLASFLPRY